MITLKQYLFPIIFLNLFILVNEASARLTISAPAKVARGDAFLVEAHSDFPADFFTFTWNGKNIQIPADNSLVKTTDKSASAKILLPVALDDKSSRKELKVKAVNSLKSVTELAQSTVTTYDKKRPVQKLTVDRKYVSPPADQLERIKKDREKVNQALSQKLSGRLWDVPLERPVSGGISSLFGLKRVFNGQPRGMHKGLDLRGAEGTPIKACADGKVVLVDNLYYSGNTVYINHGDGVFSAYLHMSKPLVQPGETVVRGQTIGLVGSTGRVTGPHLHLSIFAQGQSIDPLPLLENQGEHKTPSSSREHKK